MKVLPFFVILLAAVEAHGEAVSVLPPHQFTEGAVSEIQVHAPEYAGKNLQWRILLGNAPLASGSLGFDAGGKGVIPFQAPQLRPVEALPFQLVFFEFGREDALSESTLWVFPEDLFEETRRWMTSRKIQVYDPEGGTLAWLLDAGLPVEKIDSLDKAAPKKILLVGEGISFEKHRELFAELRVLAASGSSVLCLLPQNGMLDIFDPETGPVPERMAFAKEDQFTDWDKRLSDSGMGVGKFQLQALKQGVRLVLGTRKGWSWAEFHFGEEGKLYICGAKLVSPDTDSPAPGVLMNHLLNKMNTNQQTTGEKHD